MWNVALHEIGRSPGRQAYISNDISVTIATLLDKCSVDYDDQIILSLVFTEVFTKSTAVKHYIYEIYELNI